MLTVTIITVERDLVLLKNSFTLQELLKIDDLSTICTLHLPRHFCKIECKARFLLDVAKSLDLDIASAVVL